MRSWFREISFECWKEMGCQQLNWQLHGQPKQQNLGYQRAKGPTQWERSVDRAELKHVQGELKHSIREGKDNYKRKLQYQLENQNTRDVWSGMREITGFQRKGGGRAEGNGTPSKRVQHVFRQIWLQLLHPQLPPCCSSDQPSPGYNKLWTS